MDFSKQIAEDQRLLLADIHRRIEAALQPFANDLDDFLAILFQARLPTDWRQQWHNFVAEAATNGFFVKPKSVVELEEWIEAWARFCGLLPHGSQFGWPNSRSTIRTLLGSSENHNAPTMLGYGQPADRGEPIMLASVHPGKQAMKLPKRAKPTQTQPPAPAARKPPAPTAKFNDDGLELAGPGPDTTTSYRNKVQKALETLARSVGDWWKASSINGVVRSRAAALWQAGYYSHMEGKNQPVIVVDEDYTVGQAAAAILAEVSRTLAADSIGACYRTYRLEHKGRPEDLSDWKLAAFKELAQTTSQLAEMYVSGIATLTPVGDLVLFTTDVMERGLKLDQVVDLLPQLANLPIVSVVVTFGARRLRISKDIAKKFEKFMQHERLDVLRKMASAKTDSEAAALVTREVKEVTKGRQIHHAISSIVHEALEKHKNLKGKYKYRDSRFEAMAKTPVDHQGWEKWHRDLDNEVAAWIRRTEDATEKTFEAWLRGRYAKEDLVTKFPTPF